MSDTTRVAISADEGPRRASTASARDVEFTSEAAPYLPKAANAAEAAAAKREEMDELGAPVRSVPFAKDSVITAACVAVSAKSAAALVARELLDAALVAASKEPTGSTAYNDVAMVDV